MVGLLQAPFGTRLYERLRRAGRLRGHLSGDNADGSTNIIPRMDLQVLREGYRSILRHIYSPKGYYQRVKTFLREYKGWQRGGLPSIRDLLAFLRSIWQLGILDRGRLHYWGLLLWTFFRKPKHFALAVTLAIYGYHFRTVMERNES